MEIKPVKNIEKPKYPQKDEIDIEEVKKSLPKRWAQSPAAKIALGTLAVVSLAGCVPYVPVGSPVPTMLMTEGTVSPKETYSQTAGVTAPPVVTAEVTLPPLKTYPRTEGIVMAPTVNVAPIFLHGEGRGAFGGDMASVPAFLSEDEALGIINEAASEYGLKFAAAGGPEFYGVPQPVTNIYKPEDKKPSDKVITLKADFTDSEHGVVIEFISIDDVKQWHQKTEYSSTLEQYDTQDAAEQLSEGLERADVSGGYYTAGVLYDPCELPESPDKNSLSEEQLKAQAKEFFEWLKSQGII